MSNTSVVAQLQNRLKTSRRINLVLIVVVLFMVLVVVAQAINNTNSPAQASTESTQTGEIQEPEAAQTTLQLERRDENDPLAIGDVDAPVVLINYTDPRCPFCAKFANDVEPALREKYVDTGDVRIEFRVVAAFGPDSETTTKAVFAAGMQQKGVEYLTEIYQRHPGQGQPVHSQDDLVEIAEAVGVTDIDRFVTDMESDAVKQQLVEETSQWQELGLTSVPFFVSGDEGFSGARELSVFEDFLDEQLAQ